MQQLPFNFEHRTTFDKENFLVSSGNAEAVKIIDCYPMWPSHAVIIYGDKGCGKTHLAHVFVKKTGGKTPLIYAKDLNQEAIPELLAQSGNLVVEDIDDTNDEAAIFHLYNYTKQINGHILLTANKHPSKLQIKLPDLRSRIIAIPAIQIANPDDAFIKALIVKLFTDRQLDINEETLNYAIKNMNRSFQSANMLADMADKLSLAQKQPVTIPLLRKIFRQIENQPNLPLL